MRKAYVTGSSGFIGRRLTAALGTTRDVTAIPHARLHSTQISRFDEFYFLSSYGNLFHQTDHNEILKANVSQLLEIVGQIDVRSGFDSFVYLSSSSVGLPRQTVYSRSKRAAEEIVTALGERYALPMVIVRPFSVTGVGEQPEHLIPTLIHSCFTGTPVDFVPEPTHDFIDIEDVVSGIITLAESGATGIVELGCGRNYSNEQVLEIVERLCGSSANIRITSSMRPYDTSGWVSSGRNAREYGWRPLKTLDQSISEMVSHYRNRKIVY